MTYSMLLQILQEAEARASDESLPNDARERSRETAGIVLEKLELEGITREQLEQLSNT